MVYNISVQLQLINTRAQVIQRSFLQNLPHKSVEPEWYAWWEKSGFLEPEFGPDGKVKSKGYFVIPEPPPNVTRALHMSHALPTALQDTTIR